MFKDKLIGSYLLGHEPVSFHTKQIVQRKYLTTFFDHPSNASALSEDVNYCKQITFYFLENKTVTRTKGGFQFNSFVIL